MLLEDHGFKTMEVPRLEIMIKPGKLAGNYLFFSRFMDDIDGWPSAVEFIAGFFVYFCQGQITLPSGLLKRDFQIGEIFTGICL